MNKKLTCEQKDRLIKLQYDFSCLCSSKKLKKVHMSLNQILGL